MQPSLLRPLLSLTVRRNPIHNTQLLDNCNRYSMPWLTPLVIVMVYHFQEFFRACSQSTSLKNGPAVSRWKSQGQVGMNFKFLFVCGEVVVWRDGPPSGILMKFYPAFSSTEFKISQSAHHLSPYTSALIPLLNQRFQEWKLFARSLLTMLIVTKGNKGCSAEISNKKHVCIISISSFWCWTK